MKMLAAVGILVAVLATGCAHGKRLSKEQYVARLNAMCADFSAKEKEIGEPQSLSDLRTKEPRILEAFDEAILDKVRTLRAPEEIAAQADRLVDLAGRQHDVLSGLIRAAKTNDLTRVQELVSENQALNAEGGSIARSLGAKTCAQSR
jgi:predicted house-cleaning NTP pyrophosphatase (Maf/HAM1 superfamily)